MQPANLSPAFSISCVSAREQMPAASHCSRLLLFTVLGSRCWQALWAAWNRELLTLSRCGLVFGSAPLPDGSGKAGTPWERMLLEKPTADGELADPLAS